jgi:asparagine synthase (glutamine-hydrolysing)
MCAIFGLVSSNDIRPGWLAEMSRLLRHRGPDDEGFALFDGRGAGGLLGGEDTPEAVFHSKTAYAPRGRIGEAATGNWRLALGHRRLSILDLSPHGHQPMTRDGRYWIVFNGEIFNYLELREELRELGHEFRTESDTEVLLAAYEQWGAGCLPRFNGMWGFAIFDRVRAELFLARDRYGVKPLYYWHSPAGLAFASEIKAFTALPGWQPRLNRARAWDYLALGLSDHTEGTLFTGVNQIRGGECGQIQLTDLALQGRLSVRRWYELKPDATAASLSFADAAAAVREKLLDSVRLRLRADVPVGSCLSGGIDSSALVCCVNRLLSPDNQAPAQHTFTACSRDAAFDERHFAEIVAASTGVKACYIYPQPEALFDVLDRITWHQDEPFNTTSMYAQWSVFEAAAQAGIKVMLDGQGSDEVFAGYGGFWTALFTELLRQGRILQCHREIMAAHRQHGLPRLRTWLQAGWVASPSWVRGRVYRSSRRRLTRRSAGLGFDGETTASSGGKFDVRSCSAAQIQTANLSMLLHWEDRNSMAHSVEARTPFLDYRLVEFAFGLPGPYLLSGGWTKRLLRESLKGILPEPIRLRRDKKAFALPESSWVTGDLRSEFKKRIVSAVSDSEGIFTKRLLADFELVAARRAPYKPRFWRVLSFDAWRRQFGVQLDSLQP